MTKYGMNNVGQTGCVCFSQGMSGLKQTGQPSASTHPNVLMAEYQASYCKACFSCKIFVFTFPVYM